MEFGRIRGIDLARAGLILALTQTVACSGSPSAESPVRTPVAAAASPTSRPTEIPIVTPTRPREAPPKPEPKPNPPTKTEPDDPNENLIKTAIIGQKLSLTGVNSSVVRIPWINEENPTQPGEAYIAIIDKKTGSSSTRLAIVLRSRCMFLLARSMNLLRQLQDPGAWEITEPLEKLDATVSLSSTRVNQTVRLEADRVTHRGTTYNCDEERVPDLFRRAVGRINLSGGAEALARELRSIYDAIRRGARI